MNTCDSCKPFKKYSIIRQDKEGNRDYSICWVCSKKIIFEVKTK